MNDDAASELDIRRLWWRSRRGLRELDLLLLPFVEDIFAGLEARQQQLYLRLVDNEDQELLLWLTGRAEPLERDLMEIIELIRGPRREVS